MNTLPFQGSLPVEELHNSRWWSLTRNLLATVIVIVMPIPQSLALIGGVEVGIYCQVSRALGDHLFYYFLKTADRSQSAPTRSGRER